MHNWIQTHPLRGAEIRTKDGWVRSTNATTVLYQPLSETVWPSDFGQIDFGQIDNRPIEIRTIDIGQIDFGQIDFLPMDLQPNVIRLNVSAPFQ